MVYILAYSLMLVRIVIHKFEGVFMKKYNTKHSKGGFLFTAIVSLFSMLFFLITDRGGLIFPPELFVYGIIAGILYCSASFLTYVALGCGSYVMSSLILAYSVLFKIVYGIVGLNEPTSLYFYIGLFIILISIFLVRGENVAKDSQKRKVSLKWLVCILISFFGNGMFGIISRMQQIRFNNQCSNEFYIISLSFSAIILFIIGFIKDGKDLKYLIKHGSLYAIGSGLSNGISNSITLLIQILIPISVSAPAATGLNIVITFIISAVIFKETFLKRQLVGVVLGGIGLIFLNL